MAPRIALPVLIDTGRSTEATVTLRTTETTARRGATEVRLRRITAEAKDTEAGGSGRTAECECGIWRDRGSAEHRARRQRQKNLSQHLYILWSWCEFFGRACQLDCLSRRRWRAAEADHSLSTLTGWSALVGRITARSNTLAAHIQSGAGKRRRARRRMAMLRLRQPQARSQYLPHLPRGPHHSRRPPNSRRHDGRHRAKRYRHEGLQRDHRGIRRRAKPHRRERLRRDHRGTLARAKPHRHERLRGDHLGIQTPQLVSAWQSTLPLQRQPMPPG
jgi:hypothetical protein